jgi:hypothetical protein
MCWPTAASDIGSGAASVLTDAGPSLRRARIARRLGSARAWNIRSSRSGSSGSLELFYER